MAGSSCEQQSSNLEKRDVHFVAKLQMAAARIPKSGDAHNGRNPDDGVAAINPARLPKQRPTMLYLRSSL
jgi:hypothetical protein